MAQRLGLYKASVLAPSTSVSSLASSNLNAVHFIHFTTLGKSSVASYCSQGKVPNSYYSLSVWATCFLFTFPASAPWNQAPQRQANGSFRPRAFTRLSLLLSLHGSPWGALSLLSGLQVRASSRL